MATAKEIRHAESLAGLANKLTGKAKKDMHKRLDEYLKLKGI